jgi:DNA/RNA-binding domain of Phe-tRNA-synthetase-like protein
MRCSVYNIVSATAEIGIKAFWIAEAFAFFYILFAPFDTRARCSSNALERRFENGHATRNAAKKKFVKLFVDV